MSVFVLALDQGTTSSRALLFDREGQVFAELGTTATPFRHELLQLRAPKCGYRRQILEWLPDDALPEIKTTLF